MSPQIGVKEERDLNEPCITVHGDVSKPLWVFHVTSHQFNTEHSWIRLLGWCEQLWRSQLPTLITVAIQVQGFCTCKQNTWADLLVHTCSNIRELYEKLVRWLWLLLQAGTHLRCTHERTSSHLRNAQCYIHLVAELRRLGHSLYSSKNWIAQSHNVLIEVKEVITENHQSEI